MTEAPGVQCTGARVAAVSVSICYIADQQCKAILWEIVELIVENWEIGV